MELQRCAESHATRRVREGREAEGAAGRAHQLHQQVRTPEQNLEKFRVGASTEKHAGRFTSS